MKQVEAPVVSQTKISTGIINTENIALEQKSDHIIEYVSPFDKNTLVVPDIPESRN